MVAAGSLVAPNTTVPTGEIWAGNPAKKLRDLDAEEAEFILQSAVNYSALARIHAAENAKTTEEIEVLSFWSGNMLCRSVIDFLYIAKLPCMCLQLVVSHAHPVCGRMQSIPLLFKVL